MSPLTEDVLWLLDCGEGAETICTRLNKRPLAITRAMYRAGRPDLGRTFERLTRVMEPDRAHESDARKNARRSQVRAAKRRKAAA